MKKIKVYVGNQPENPDGSRYELLHLSESIDDICEDAECVELVLEEVLCYLPIDILEQYLSKFISKIRLNGVIVVGGTDLAETIRVFQNKNLSLNEFNYTIYGEPGEMLAMKSSIFNASYIINLFKKSGFKILSNDLENTYFLIKAQRII